MKNYNLKYVYRETEKALAAIALLGISIRNVRNGGGDIPANADIYCAKITEWLLRQERSIEEEWDEQPL